MAKNDRDRLIQTFMARTRRQPNLRVTTPTVTRGGFRPQKGGAASRTPFRPAKQGTVTPYKPPKRNQRIARY